MGLARKRQISLSDTRYYHCVSRCVRRAFLCGEDKFTGKSYEHRRGWVEDRLLFLAQVFCIDVCAYAVMSNHTHVVLYVDDKKAQRLNDRAVLLRWHKLFKGSILSHKYLQGERLDEGQRFFLNKEITEYRNRLSSISWFMRVLNEGIARAANREDNCTGRFWEGRFKSQALLDEAALMACMAYVDLNPIRAKISKTPEESAHTSIKRRCEYAQAGKQPKVLARFAGSPRIHMPKGLPFELKSYLELVELTGKCIRTDKRGYIEQHQAPILERLNIKAENWLKLTTQFEQVFKGAVGKERALDMYCERATLKRRRNINNSKALLA
ncbi:MULTISPECIES: transposase [Pseudoalteromonas]|uniref:Transposase n=1 Tax=Pseudoalteromonas amylolytica TaxID=1859457 RepID=A0A1S1N0R1_9GAMM|nr:MULTISPECIES: transposase [Pseudoalteromonas]OHU88186.1 transposase [Pseudoalteromonas sp. JW3]OHU91626.1 transposase [Pseudoalteromonas amylolytica]